MSCPICFFCFFSDADVRDVFSLSLSLVPPVYYVNVHFSFTPGLEEKKNFLSSIGATPNGMGAVNWPTFTTAGDAHLDISATPVMGAGLRRSQCDVITPWLAPPM